MASNGRFCWYELMTTDPRAAKDFYTKVIGWSTEEWRGSPMPYELWKTARGPVGGVMELPDEAKAKGVPPNWLAYIEVDDVPAAAEKAGTLGGKVEKEHTEIPSMGSFAIISDPQGAMFAIYRSDSEEQAPPGGPGVGDFSWHELATTDHEAAWEFYGALCGWRKADVVDMGDMGVYQMFARAEHPIGGMFNKSKDTPGPPFWLYYVKVESVHRIVEKVGASGGQVLDGPMQVTGGDWIARCVDPQGAAFAIHSSARG